MFQHATSIADDHDPRPDQLQYRLIYAVSFGVCLVGATLSAISGRRFRPWGSGPGGYRSILAETRSAANTVAVMAMMS